MTDRDRIDKVLALMHEQRHGRTFKAERFPRDGTWAIYCGSFYVPVPPDVLAIYGAAEVAKLLIDAFEAPGSPV